MSETVFAFNGKMPEQADSASMQGSIEPVLANIIITECKKVVLN